MSDRAVRSIIRVIGIILLIAAFYLLPVHVAAAWSIGALGFVVIMLS